MNKKLLVLLILFLGGIAAANAQEEEGKIVIKGIIMDAQTNQPVAFANLGLLGTVAGVASDIDGKFELTVPDRYATHVVRVSAVGYAAYEMKVYEAKDKEITISLKPVTYGIKEVDVYGQSLVYQRMLKNVVANIGKNYIGKPYNYEGYFKYGITTNGENEKVKEAVVKIYDAKGYERSDVATAFKDLNYSFSEVRRSQPVKSVMDGLNYFDDILTADIVRNTRNILDIRNARDYKLKNKGVLQYEGDSVQVIAYEVAKPSLSTTGDASVVKYDGEIYVNLKDKSVIKNVMHIASKDFNILGRNLIPIDETPKSNVRTTIVTNYKKLNSVYFLSGATIEYTYRSEGNEIKGEMQYVTTRVNMDSPEAVNGRMYYEDLKTNENFWNRYSVYFEN